MVTNSLTFCCMGMGRRLQRQPSQGCAMMGRVVLWPCINCLPAGHTRHLGLPACLL